MMENPKIGIGPTGPVAGLIQFIVFAVAGIVIFVYAIPLDLIVLKIIPATLIMLVALGCLALLGENFPLAPPGGAWWNPDKPRYVPGIGLTAIWVIFTFVLLLFMRFVYPGWPIGPLYLWFGVIAFWLTLLYGINWNGWPFKGRLHPWGTMAAGFIIIMGLTILVWNLLTNLDGTPFAETPMNHKGPFNVNWLTGYLVWCIAWFFVFNPAFHNPGMAICQVGTSRRSNRSNCTCPCSGLCFLAGESGPGHQPNLFFCCGGLFDHFLVPDLLVAPSVLGDNPIHPF